MKILNTIIQFVLSVAFIAFVSVLATFFISIFMPMEVQNALEIFKSIFS